jgi:hypothetical protein
VEDGKETEWEAFDAECGRACRTAIEARDRDNLGAFEAAVESLVFLRHPEGRRVDFWSIAPRSFREMYGGGGKPELPRIAVFREKHETRYADVGDPDVFASEMIGTLRRRTDQGFYGELEETFAAADDPLADAYLGSLAPRAEAFACRDGQGLAAARRDWRATPEFQILLRRVPLGNLLAAIQGFQAAAAPEHLIAFLAFVAAVQDSNAGPTLRRILSRDGAGPITQALRGAIPATDREKAEGILASVADAVSSAEIRKAGRRAFEMLSARARCEYEGIEIAAVSRAEPIRPSLSPDMARP